MPTTLPDPVLALSMASLQKLNTADVDQLANLWNVFTKCKESLESGRRLENLSWRLWFREAHLLPPDTSLSDLTDFTPLDTPLMSRRSSIAGSFQPRTMSTFIPSQQQQQQSQQQPSNSLTSRALHAASIAMATTPANRTTKVIQTELSDPEDGEDWSSEDDDSEEEEKEGEKQIQNNTKIQNRGRTREQAFSPSTSSYPTKSSLKSGKNNSAITSPKSISSPLARVDEQQQDIPSIIPTTKSSIIQPGDRKRAVSSSSAFGSRARVKQHNMQRRRRPLSFQQAIESLLLDGHENDLSLRKRNFDFGNGSVASLPKSIDESIGRNVEDIESFSSNLTISSDQKLPQNSAPAEFSRPSTPQRMNSISSAIVEKKPIRRVSIADVEETKESKPSSRFFVGGASFEGSEHSLESENSSSIIKNNSTKSPVQAFKNLHPTFSDAGSNDGNRKASGSRPHHHNHHNHHHHHPHPHHHHPHHGKALTGNTRIKSALNLHKNGGKAKQNHVRIASISKEPAHEIAPEQEEEEIASDKKRQPVKFTMGSIGSESDEDSLSNRKSAKASKSVDSDEWASDSSTDSEEERKKTDERRKREERERVENMFKKIPIRSQSAADVRHLQPQSSNNELHHHHHQSDESSVEDLQSVSPAPPPIRSLLSTIFHPEREGDFATANSTTNSKNHKQKRKTSHEGSEIAQTVNNLRKNNESEMESNTPANIPRLPSIGSYMNNVGMKMSKSAVALPVLSTLGSRSSTSLSRNTAVFDDASSEEDKNSDGQSSTFGHPSRQSNNSEAVERLNELAQSKQKQKNKKRQQKRSSSNADSIRRSSADERGQIRNRTSNSSLDVQVQPDFNEEEMILQHRRTSEPFEIPSTGNSIQRSKSAVNVPAGLPQSPRTTRRNMLRDELSESLRQNLLWERQSRNRMLGIGGNRLMNDNVQQQQQSNKPNFPALTTTTSEPSQSHSERNVVQSQPPQPSFNRNQSVLGGNALRPLTQRSSTTNYPTNATNDENTVSSSSQRRSRVNYSGDFHHTGW